MKEYDPNSKEYKRLKLLGKRLRHFRKLKGHKTAEAAANKINVQRAQYARYEAGQNLTYLTLVDVLDKLEVSLSDFFSEGFDWI